MFSNVFNTIWSNPANRILEKQIHGETVVLAENEGRLCAAKRVGNEFVSLILSGIPTKVNTTLDKALTCAQLKDSNLQLVGPQLTVLPRLKGGWDPEVYTNPDAFRKWLKENPTMFHLHSAGSAGGSNFVEKEVLPALAGSQISIFSTGKDGAGQAPPITAEYGKALAAVLPHTKISTLCFDCSPIDPKAILAMVDVLPSTQIKFLKLRCAGITTEGICALAAALPQSQVTYLSLEHSSISDEAATALAMMLPRSRIQWLHLRHSGWHPTLLKALPLSQVRWLDYSANGYTGSTKALIEVLPYLSELQYLYLDENNMNAEDAKALAAVLPQSKLRWLSLSQTQIGDQGVKALAKVLPKSRLFMLNLSNSCISDEGAEALAKALPHSQLRELYLSGYQPYYPWNNKIGDAGAKALVATLPLSRLLALNLSGNPIEEEGIRSFIKAIPNLIRLKVLILGNHYGKASKDFLDESIQTQLCDAFFQSQLTSFTGKQPMMPKSVDEMCKSRKNILCNAINTAISECNIDRVASLLEENVFEDFNQDRDRNGTLVHFTSGDTALHLAVRQNHPALVNLVLKYCPDPWRSNIKQTSFQLAQSLGFEDIAQLIAEPLEESITLEADITPPPEVEVPASYYCPQTWQIFYDPVIAANGKTYEREAIEEHFKTYNTSPDDVSVVLQSKMLIPNAFCKGLITELIQKYPHLEQQTYIPIASRNACLAALRAQDVSSLKDLLVKDSRLLSVGFPDGRLIELACSTSPELLKVVIEAYPTRPYFNHLLCIKAAEGLGAEGVRLILSILPKQEPVSLRLAILKAAELTSGAYTRALLELGANPNTIDSEGHSLLHMAVEAGSKELITILMEHDANLKAVDREERTPLQLAEQLGKLDLVRHIKQKKTEIKLRPLLAPIQEQINLQGRVIQQLRGALIETQTSLGNIVPLLGANPSLSSVTDELTELQKRIDQTFN